MVILVKERLPTFVADNGDHILVPALLHKVLRPDSLDSDRSMPPVGQLIPYGFRFFCG